MGEPAQCTLPTPPRVSPGCPTPADAPVRARVLECVCLVLLVDPRGARLQRLVVHPVVLDLVPLLRRPLDPGRYALHPLPVRRLQPSLDLGPGVVLWRGRGSGEGAWGGKESRAGRQASAPTAMCAGAAGRENSPPSQPALWPAPPTCGRWLGCRPRCRAGTAARPQSRSWWPSARDPPSTHCTPQSGPPPAVRCRADWRGRRASSRGSGADTDESSSAVQSSSSIRCASAMPGRSPSPCHLCTGRPLPIPEALFALMLAAVDAVVFVPCGKAMDSLRRPDVLKDGGSAMSETSGHVTLRRLHRHKHWDEWSGVQDSAFRKHVADITQHHPPCENLSRPPSLASMADRMLLKICHRYCRQVRGGTRGWREEGHEREAVAF